VDLVVDSTRSIPNKVKISEGELFQKDLDKLIVAQGEPFSTLSIYAQFKVFELAKRKGIKVTLDGQGADEMLAGYQGYPESRILSLLETGDFLGLAKFTKNWTKWPGRSLKFLLGLGVSEFLPQLRKSEGFIKASQALGFMSSHSLELFSDEVFSLSSANPVPKTRSKNYTGRRLVESLQQALGPKGLTSLLRFADRNSMHSSIESRVPFLNRKLVEYTLSLPEHFLISQAGETKSILRKALVGVVPQAILDRRDKIGFEASTANWGIGSPILIEISKNLDAVPLLNPNSARQAINSVFEGSAPLSANTWRLINFARWVQLEEIAN
jgi:asparagine synthase (glutamine-hydrolysing)